MPLGNQKSSISRVQILKTFYSTQFFIYLHETFSKLSVSNMPSTYKREITRFPLFYAQNHQKEDLKKYSFFGAHFWHENDILPDLSFQK